VHFDFESGYNKGEGKEAITQYRIAVTLDFRKLKFAMDDPSLIIKYTIIDRYSGLTSLKDKLLAYAKDVLSPSEQRGINLHKLAPYPKESLLK
jgi:hypothetical protein